MSDVRDQKGKGRRTEDRGRRSEDNLKREDEKVEERDGWMNRMIPAGLDGKDKGQRSEGGSYAVPGRSWIGADFFVRWSFLNLLRSITSNVYALPTL